MNAIKPVGDLLREWRQRRRMSQLDLACEAEISTRHLSFVETGRSQPSREMILHLAEMLEIPVRERNLLLVAAGFAPIFRERPLDDPALTLVRNAIDMVLERQKPYPAFGIDRHWNVAMSNAALPELYTGVSEELLERPVNAARLTLHPKGMAPRIANFAEWRAHTLTRLRHDIDLTADPVLVDLLREVSDFPAPVTTRPSHAVPDPNAVLIPFKVMTDAGLLSFVTTTTLFGTPIDVTLSELAVELFFPADAETDAIVRQLDQKRAAASRAA
jgi:transcriptional regulator with XRE-family HTH domain